MPTKNDFISFFNKYKKHPQFIAVLVSLISFILIFSTLFYQWYLPHSFSSKSHIITISPGSSTHKIARDLKKSKLIKNIFFFKLYVKTIGNEKAFYAGTFQINSGLSIPKIVATLQGKYGAGKLTKVTIPEGFSIKAISNALEKAKLVEGRSFLHYLRTQAKESFIDKFPFLDEIPTKTIEGYLYPETYFFAPGVSKEEIVSAMLHQFKINIVDQWTQLSTPKKHTFHEYVTLASLIEMEAKVPEEMKMISSVFENRIKKGMRLATDPTIIYALGEPDIKRVLYRHLEVKSPYNTYRNKGLPPGPISSPGKDAFFAALYPNKTPYFFFVSNRDGTHYFSETFAEHSKRIREIKKEYGEK